MEIFEGLELSEDAKATITKEIDKIKEEAKASAQNDGEFIRSLKSQAKAEAYQKAEKALRSKYGVDFDSIDKDLKEGDRLSAGMELVLKEVKSKSSSTNQSLQEELATAKSEIERIRKEEIPAVEAQWQNRFKQKNIEAFRLNFVNKHEKVEDKDNAGLWLEAVIGKNFVEKWDDEKGYYIETKDGLKPQIGDKVVNEEELLNHWLEKGKLLKHSKGTKREERATVRVENNGEMSDHAKSLAKKLGISA